MDSQKLQIIIEMLRQGDAKGAISELEKLGTTQDKSGKSSKDASEKMTGFGEAMVGTATRALGWAAVIGAGISIAKDSIRAYEEQQLSIDRLNGSMRAGGQFTEEYSSEIQSLADELQQMSKVDDGDILNVSSTLIQFGAMREELPKFLEMVLDMKAAGLDMQSSASAIGAGLQGQFGPLQKLLKTEFPEGATRAEKLALAISLLEQRFGGLARSTAGGLGGMKDLQIEMNNLKEDFGKFLLTGIEPYVRQITQGIVLLRAVIRSTAGDDNGNRLGEQMEDQRASLSAAVAARVEFGRLTKEQGAAMDELIAKTGTAEEVYKNFATVWKSLQNGTALPVGQKDLSANYDPERAKRELADLEKELELKKKLAQFAAPRTEKDTPEGVMNVVVEKRDEKVDELLAAGVIKTEEANKQKAESDHQYWMEFIRLAEEGKAVDNELSLNSMNSRQRELDQIHKHYREAGEALQAYYDFRVKLAGENSKELESIEEARAKATTALLKEQARAQSEAMQLIQKVGQTAVQSFSSGISSAFVEFVRGTKSAEEAFGEFASSFLAQISQMILQQIIFNAIKNSSVGGFLGLAGGGVVASGGVRMAAEGGMFGAVSSPTYFPQFNTVAGEAGREILAVLSRPTAENFNGVAAQVGNVGSRRMALVEAGALEAATGKARLSAGGSSPSQGGSSAPHGNLTINVSLAPGLLANVQEQSIAGAVVRITHEMQHHGEVNAAMKRGIGGT